MDHDPFDYCPIKSGVGPSSAVVPKLGKSTGLSILEIDSESQFYIDSKHEVVNAYGKDWFYQNRLDQHSTDYVTDWLYKTVMRECPMFFPQARGGVDDFDYEAMRLPEDFVVMQLDKEGVPRAQLIHLHHPNGWSADGYIGKNFSEIHEDVLHRNGKAVLPQANKMASHFCKHGGQFERVGAISFRVSPELNRHPNIPSTGGEIDIENSPLYMRFERQTITGLPEINAFMFTIKTYFCDVYKPERREDMIKAFSSVHENAYARWFTDAYRERVLRRLTNGSL